MEEVGCILSGKGSRDRRWEMTALKRALWNNLTNEHAVRSQVASAGWSSWLQRDLIRTMTFSVRTVAPTA